MAARRVVRIDQGDDGVGLHRRLEAERVDGKADLGSPGDAAWLDEDMLGTAAKARDLRRMKLFAGALLVLAAGVFVICVILLFILLVMLILRLH